VAASVVAQLLGLSSVDFDARLPALRERGFPDPDATTGSTASKLWTSGDYDAIRASFPN
jgi:hypothetical protein